MDWAPVLSWPQLQLHPAAIDWAAAPAVLAGSWPPHCLQAPTLYRAHYTVQGTLHCTVHTTLYCTMHTTLCTILLCTVLSSSDTGEATFTWLLCTP